MIDRARIVEVDGTNLLMVVTNFEKNATYYSKQNLEVFAQEGNLVLQNEGVLVLSLNPRDVLEPQEESVADLVEIIQGYLNNVIPENQAEIDVLTEILNTNNYRNSVLDLIRQQNNAQNEIIEELQRQTKYLRKIYNPE